ncbi:nucleotide sugar dehydrogenase [Gammaproteobacteria bacterium]|nr:nucleotide sugar dehydrogenase [Gammaproteobacteria bacterium]
MELSNIKLAIIGLGYVGLPLAVEFAKTRSVLGFDINSSRVASLKKGEDATLEISSESLKAASSLTFSSDLDALKTCNCFIVTVPTPVDDQNKPNLQPLLAASKMLGTIIQSGDLIIFESTVYPGATEEDCAPVIEKYSDLVLNHGFFLGYSPERINPGDKTHTVRQIIKITSGSSPQTADLVDALYSTIIDAGTHKAPSIKIAEAAKVIENTQRDVNIALINELSIIFNKLEIDTEEVLLAAGTKWNFLPFRPGLVGGHCIGVDPYYLTQKAESVGYTPEIILAGRRLNDNMSSYVSKQALACLQKNNINSDESNILIMGLTFKENCPDTRNSKVFDIVDQLYEHCLKLDIYDPWVEQLNTPLPKSVELVAEPALRTYDLIILTVAHQIFLDLGIHQIREFGKQTSFIYDLKFMFPSKSTDIRL